MKDEAGGIKISTISKDGLIITNHHVALDAVRSASDTTHDYLKDGFVAKERKEELMGRDYECWITRSVVDVSDQLSDARAETDPLKRANAIRDRRQELAREAESLAESLAASASPGGNGESRAGDETENSAFLEAFAAAADVKFADVKSTSNATRVSVVFRTRAPAWSCVRVRGDVTAWSLSPTLPGTPPGAA